jgi:hypothetical protein
MKILERSLYPDVAVWLKERLRWLYPGWKVEVHDTSRVRLSSFLDRRGLARTFAGSEAFEIEVDISGVLRRGDRSLLAFVECKTEPISLKDIGQILGYSLVASPVIAVILSPSGVSTALNLLLNTYNRTDLLQYAKDRRIKVGTWDIARKQIDPASVIPAGELG